MLLQGAHLDDSTVHDPRDLLQGFAVKVLRTTASASLDLSVWDPRLVTAPRQLQVDAPPGPEHRSGQVLETPLRYGGSHAGTVRLQITRLLSSNDLSWLRHECRALCFDLRRRMVRASACVHLGRDLLLAGSSPAMRRFDRLLERPSKLWILLQAKDRVLAEDLATALHLSHDEPGPLVISEDAKATAERRRELLDAASGGTLLIRGVDEIGSDDRDHWLRDARCRGQPLRRQEARLMFVLSSDPPEAVPGMLALRLPPLGERAGDVPELLRQLLARLCGLRRVRLTAGFIASCQDYGWPGGIEELVAAAARLYLLEEPLLENQHLAGILPLERTLLTAAGTEQQPALHPTLCRALRYLAKNYQKPLRIADVARASYTSVSNLSHLLQQHLGSTYGELLRNIRIERTQVLLTRSPHTITEIAFSCGFTSLRSFERAFKRVAGCTARQFRKAAHIDAPKARNVAHSAGSMASVLSRCPSRMVPAGANRCEPTEEEPS